MAYIPKEVAGKLGPEKLPVGWPWRLFLFSVLVLAATIVVYGGLEYGYKNYLNARIKVKDAAIADLAQTISPEEQQEFVNFYSQLVNLRALLDKHTFVSQLLPLLENNTNRAVYYNLISFSAKDRRLVLGGAAASYKALSQQLEAFKKMPEVERLLINESERKKGHIQFKLNLFLSSNLFSSS